MTTPSPFSKTPIELWLDKVCKPQVSLARQALAAVLLVPIGYVAFVGYVHVPYWLEHFEAFVWMTLFGYAISGSWRLAWPLLAIFALGNELVVDMLKPNHPNIDVDQLCADFVGIWLASWFLGALNGVMPGTTWKSAEENRAWWAAIWQRLRVRLKLEQP